MNYSKDLSVAGSAVSLSDCWSKSSGSIARVELKNVAKFFLQEVLNNKYRSIENNFLLLTMLVDP